MILSNFPKIGYVFRVRTASGPRNYEIFPKIGYVFGVRTASDARDCGISIKWGMFSESGFHTPVWNLTECPPPPPPTPHPPPPPPTPPPPTPPPPPHPTPTPHPHPHPPTPPPPPPFYCHVLLKGTKTQSYEKYGWYKGLKYFDSEFDSCLIWT